MHTAKLWKWHIDDQTLRNSVSQPVHKAALPFDFTDLEVKSKSESQQGKPALSTKGNRPRGRVRKYDHSDFPRKAICDLCPRSFPLHSRSQIIRKGDKGMYASMLTWKPAFGFFTVNSESYYSYRNEDFKSQFSNATQHFVLFSWPIYASFDAQHDWHPCRTDNTQSHITFLFKSRVM